MDKQIKILDYGIDENGFLGVMAISVVTEPAIESNWIFLSKENKVNCAVETPERRMLYGAIMIPDKEILRIDENNQEYYIRFSKDVVKQVAYDYYKKNLHHNATYQHEFAVLGLTLVESWIVEGENDKSKNFGFNLPEGTWFGGMKVDNDEIWSSVKDGEVKGFSIEGMFQDLANQTFSEVDAQGSLLLQELERILQATQDEISVRYDDYMNAVNMTYSELKSWSETECSKLASLDRSPIERNLELLQTNKDEWSDKHFEWAGKTIAFINRMKENTAGDNVTDENGNDCGSKRTISLMNWAYNPNK